MQDQPSLRVGFDEMRERESKRIDPNCIKPVVVNNVSDIQRIIHTLSPDNHDGPEVIINAVMDVEEDNAKYELSASTQSKSKRSMIIEAFDIIKRQMQITSDGKPVTINGVDMRPAPLFSHSNSRSYIDPMVKHWTGGYRNCLTICWDLNDGYTYMYDIYEHKLAKKKRI